jgi:hypothetical protein
MTFELQKESGAAIQALHRFPFNQPKKKGAPIGRPSEALLGERISLSEAEISSNEKSFQVPFRGVEARTHGSANQKNFQQRRASCSTTSPELVQMQENLCIN